MPNIRWLLALITSLHRRLYLATRGRIGHRALHFRFLLLGCRGRRSGRERIVPLLYVEDTGRFVVVGSNAGDTRDPAWWINLRAQPDAWAQVGGATRRGSASAAWEARSSGHDSIKVRPLRGVRTRGGRC
jgi:deazaflavin-dependent oxidoreductase (nitroreductase family)